MVFGRLLLPGVTIHACWVEEILLVATLVIAYLASADASLPACSFAYVIPAFLVIAFAISFLMVLMHERVVEESEGESH